MAQVSNVSLQQIGTLNRVVGWRLTASVQIGDLAIPFEWGTSDLDNPELHAAIENFAAAIEKQALADLRASLDAESS